MLSLVFLIVCFNWSNSRILCFNFRSCMFCFCSYSEIKVYFSIFAFKFIINFFPARLTFDFFQFYQFKFVSDCSGIILNLLFWYCDFLFTWWVVIFRFYFSNLWLIFLGIALGLSKIFFWDEDFCYFEVKIRLLFNEAELILDAW